MTKVKFGGFSGEQLRQYIAKIEKLEDEKAEIGEQIRESFAEAKANGFDPKIMKKVIKLRKMKPQERQEEESLLDVYLHALGMAPEAAEEESEEEMEAA